LSKRWLIFIGRVGAVLIASGLALVMLSLIPPQKVENTNFTGTSMLQPETFSIESSFFLSQTLDPQRGLLIDIQANNSVTAYLLQVSNDYIYGWVASHFPETQPYPTLDLTILEAFLNNHPDSVAWQENVVNEQFSFSYIPTKLMNVTLLFSNPGAASAEIRYSGELLNFIVPSERALNPTKYLISVGFVLSIPWMNLMWKRRTARRIHGCQK